MTSHRPAPPLRAAGFSLIELMVAMVILGAGLVMVATMFPVAWERTRRLSEHTVQQSMVPAAQTNVWNLVPVAGPDFLDAGYAGDLITYTPTGSPLPAIVSAYPLGSVPPDVQEFSDTRVHALNLQNLLAVGRTIVAEDPWRLEQMPAFEGGSVSWEGFFGAAADDVLEQIRGRTYHTPRLGFHQRVYPSVPPFPSDPGVEPEVVEAWHSALDTKRFVQAVFHRFADVIVPLDYDPLASRKRSGLSPVEFAKAAVKQDRRFEVFYVTLRRPQPAARYARQNWDPAFLPDPYAFKENTPVIPQARPGAEDVLLPVPWRVQIELPASLPRRIQATGIPTEVSVPPPGVAQPDSPEQAMLVAMFPPGAQFIDEVNGNVYRVVQRRLVKGDAFLTLDREITLEDIDLPYNDPRCPDPDCLPVAWDNPQADPEELRRTVWVFPPPALPRDNTGDLYPFFDGSSPVIDISIRPLTISPRTR